MLLLHRKLFAHHILVHHAIELLLHRVHVLLLGCSLSHSVAFCFLLGHGVSSKHIINHTSECILVDS